MILTISVAQAGTAIGVVHSRMDVNNVAHVNLISKLDEQITQEDGEVVRMDFDLEGEEWLLLRDFLSVEQRNIQEYVRSVSTVKEMIDKLFH